ncbi:MAG: biotin--[acetyl-CoA-carboxylase] ligase [Gammaproteobacteria bacterium]|jgi:BirA family biotin operon repressor/biotin-[acetyl-CoA-carboxylase] ligase
MITSEIEVLKILADGELYSGQVLAEKMGVSRAAIWKKINNIKNKNVEIKSIKGKGYCLTSPIELLDENIIRNQLSASVHEHLQSLKLLYQTKSTNQYLMEQIACFPIHANVLLAEYQSEGKGRGKNKWLSGPGIGLCLSIGWHFDYIPKTFSALSLAIGVVIAKSLAKQEIIGIKLKWPNDVLYEDAKLGGILIESRGQHAGSVDVVIGIGINVNLPSHLSCQIEQKTTDLSHVYGYLPSRNSLAVILINSMFELLSTYQKHGFEEYIDDWCKLDVSKGKQGIVHLNDNNVEGTVDGIDHNGNLLMIVNGKRTKYSSGDLTIKLKK